MAAPFISMLKMNIPPEKLTPEWLGVGDGEVNKIGVNSGVEPIKKSKKMSKSQNLAKLENVMSWPRDLVT